MTSPFAGCLAALALGLPAYTPINPMAASRSGLYAPPYVEPGGAWRSEVALDYASLIESPLDAPGYLIDAEMLRLGLTLGHDLGRGHFLLLEVDALGSYNGFLDGPVDTYHRLLGVSFLEREQRPRNQFAYVVTLPDGTRLERRSSSFFLGDLRLGLGRRLAPGLQALFSLTLPTTTAPTGYGRGVPSASVIATLRRPIGARFTYQGSLGFGITPEHGELSSIQRTRFVSASSGLEARLFGQQSVFGSVFFHNPYYHDTGVRALDRYELSLDLGWTGRTGGGHEWRLGLTEDLKISGPAVDLILRAGLRF